MLEKIPNQLKLSLLSLIFTSDANTMQEHNNTQFLFHDLDGSINRRVKIFRFSRAYAYAWVCAATNENEKPLRHGSVSTRIFTTRGYVWPMKMLDLDHLAPKQFGRFR